MGFLDLLRAKSAGNSEHSDTAAQPDSNSAHKPSPFDIESGLDDFSGDVLLICPLYPTYDNPYHMAYIHRRIRTYLDAGLKVDVACKDFDGESKVYEFEGVTVHNLGMQDLLYLLRHTHYPVIAIHFIENEYARVLESCDLSASRVLLWCHDGESMYWDRQLFTTPYFTAPRIFPPDEVEDMRRRDAMLSRFNERPNTTFVFVSDYTYRRSAELIGVEWHNWCVVPNYIDFDIFAYREKDPELGAHVFTAKSQINTSNYSLDLVVRTILELSRRPCFDKMHFTIVGAGEAHDFMLAPVIGMDNVRIIDKFLPHHEIAAEHAKHGVGFYPTRFDTQGVSMCEAAASGLAVVSSKRDSVSDFLSDYEGLLVETNDHVAYADTLERLCEDADYFRACCKASYEKVMQTCAREITIDREIELLSDHSAPAASTPYVEPEAPVLTLAVVGQDEAALAALRRLAAEQGCGLIEVLGAANVRQAIAQARGTYVRLMGPRDFCDPEHTGSFVDYLGHAAEDVVLTDWWSMAERTDAHWREGWFHFMVPGQRYSHADLDLPRYGFADAWPALAACTLKRSWLETVANQADEEGVLEGLLAEASSLAGSLSYCPLPAYYVRDGLEAH